MYVYTKQSVLRSGNNKEMEANDRQFLSFCWCWSLACFLSTRNEYCHILMNVDRVCWLTSKVVSTDYLELL